MKKITAFLLLLGLFSACRQNNPQQANISSAETGSTALPEGFEAFYAYFHTDSLFQIDHIHWPLAGMTSNQQDTSGLSQMPFEWQRSNWKMHRKVDFSQGEYKQDIQNVGDVLVVEKIRTSMGNYGLERRFAKRSDGGWELIYYSDMHEIGK